VNGLLLIQALRPDRLTAMARVFVEKSLGSAFLHGGEKELNLSGIVENEVIYLRNKSWKPECVLSFNMGWQILVNFIPHLWLEIKY
jgi:hypothetical protein